MIAFHDIHMTVKTIEGCKSTINVKVERPNRTIKIWYGINSSVADIMTNSGAYAINTVSGWFSLLSIDASELCT